MDNGYEIKVKVIVQFNFTFFRLRAAFYRKLIRWDLKKNKCYFPVPQFGFGLGPICRTNSPPLSSSLAGK